ncbi:MAG: hypothetical protein AB8G99_21255, partial [Planctomycetaceae bacterium]
MWRQAALLGVLIAQPAYADLITVSTNAEVSALFGDFSSTTPNTDSSASNSGSVSTSQADNRSFTSADITAFNFDTGTDTFSASALIIAEKTVSARPGGDHTGIASYEVSFTVDSQMDYTLSGTWGFLNNAAAGPADLLTYSLVDSGGATLDSGSTTANVLTDPFSSSGT